MAVKDPAQMAAAEEIYQQLWAAGFEALIDDRDERAGVKFKDADLIGIPIRIVVGAKNLAEGKVELKQRSGGDMELLSIEDAVSKVKSIVSEALGI